MEQLIAEYNLEFETNSEVYQIYEKRILAYQPTWQQNWLVQCHRKCCFSPDCGKIPCDWCNKPIILNKSQEPPAATRYNCPICFKTPDICYDLCQDCFEDPLVYHQHSEFIHIDPEGVHYKVTRMPEEGDNALALENYMRLNPDISTLHIRKANENDLCVCYDVEASDLLVELECDHAYHKDCLAAYFKTKQVSAPPCPECSVSEREIRY
eukprot:TRINITY_DN3011_c0_g1_i1.p1 TRINITY_DN3011_c0_g1~~TRINITY_DN3011_c0_g1_i1.p1  ORF type:complete len:210 (-),score=24.26 TRINITY_DN3011_c0_g1_i1:72-701(-)